MNAAATIERDHELYGLRTQVEVMSRLAKAREDAFAKCRDERARLRAVIVVLCEGLNAATDNADAWTLAEMRGHLQALRVEAEAAS